MSKNSSAVDIIGLVGVGAHGFLLYRAFQQLRRRVVNPDMNDPGIAMTRWLAWIAPVAAAIVVAIGIATVWAWGGFIGIALTLVCALVVAVAAMALAAYLWLSAEDYRRAMGYVVCEADYPDAPRQIKSTMRRIYRSGHVVRTGQAHQQGMFGEVELDRLVFASAQQAIVASGVAAGIRGLRSDANAGDRELIADAEKQIKEITKHLSDVEARFKRTASTASQLSESIAEPDRLRAEQKAREEASAAAEVRRRQARQKLEQATVEAKATERMDATDLEDRVSAVAAGYVEASRISRQTLSGDQLADGDSVKPASTLRGSLNKDEIREAAINAAKSTAQQAATRTTEVGREGLKRFRKYLDDK